MGFIGLILLILIIAVVSISLVLGFAIGVGWIITLILPFTLFEASLLALITSIVVGTFWNNILNPSSRFGFNPFDDDEEEDEYEYEEDFKHIPTTRFYNTPTDKTWDAWLNHQLADAIYIEFQETPHAAGLTNDTQQQELAIRLAEIAMSILKAKNSRAKQLTVSMSALKKQMTKRGQRPYDDDILRVATTAINADLDYYYDELIPIVHAKRWQSPCDIFDW